MDTNNSLTRETKELIRIPLRRYENTKLYKLSITLMETAYRIASKELERRAKYIMGTDLCKHTFEVNKTLIRIYSTNDTHTKACFIKALKYKVAYLLATLRAIDNAHVRMTKVSYGKMLEICTTLFSASDSAFNETVERV